MYRRWLTEGRISKKEHKPKKNINKLKNIQLDPQNEKLGENLVKNEIEEDDQESHSSDKVNLIYFI